MSKIYLAIALPKLALGIPLEITRHELDFMLDQNLMPYERKYIDDLRRLSDVTNAIRWFQGKSISQQGTISSTEYEIALIEEDREKLPKLIVDFMEKFPDSQDRKKRAEPLLFEYLSQYCIPKELFVETNEEGNRVKEGQSISHTHPIVLKIYAIEHLFRLLLAYLRSQELKDSGQHETAGTTSAAEKYALDGVRTFGFSFEHVDEWPEIYKPLYQIWKKYKDEPLELDNALSEWKFQALENLLAPTDFSSLVQQFGIREILVYCAQYDLVELENMKKPTPYMSFIERISKSRKP